MSTSITPSGLHPPRRHMRPLLVTICTLLTGVVIGAGGMTFLIARQARLIANDPSRIRGMLAEQLDARFDLTTDQRSRIDAILAERFSALDAIRAEVHPRASAEIDKLRDEVAAVLRPEQAARWKARIDALRAEFMPGASR